MTTYKLRLWIPAAAIAAIVLTSCAMMGEPNASEKAAQEEQAEKAAKASQSQQAKAAEAPANADQQVVQESLAFYKSIADGSFDGAIAYIHPKAVEATPKSQWLKLLEDTKAKFGKLKKTNIIDSRKFDQVNTIVGQADYYQLEFENVYENGTLYEMLSFVKEAGSSKPRLLSYSYNSDKSKVVFETF